LIIDVALNVSPIGFVHVKVDVIVVNYEDKFHISLIIFVVYASVGPGYRCCYGYRLKSVVALVLVLATVSDSI